MYLPNATEQFIVLIGCTIEISDIPNKKNISALSMGKKLIKLMFNIFYYVFDLKEKGKNKFSAYFPTDNLANQFVKNFQKIANQITPFYGSPTYQTTES